MKLQILSGLNLEEGEFHPPETDADVVVLAGDIGHGAHGLQWASHAFDKPVVYVPGNHEFHDFDLGVLDELKREAAALGIHLLDRDAVDIGGVRFLGCTLWTDFDLLGPDRRIATMRAAERWADDFQFISDYGRPFTPQRARDIHLADRGWLLQRSCRSTLGWPYRHRDAPRATWWAFSAALSRRSYLRGLRLRPHEPARTL